MYERGKKMKKYKKAIFSLGLAVLLGGGLAACGSTTDAPSSSSEPKKEDTVYAFGEEVIGKSKMAVIVHSIEETTDSGSDFAKITEGKKHVIIDVTLTNNSDKELPYNPFYFSVKSEAGIQSTIALSLIDGTLQSGTLAPGDLVRGKVVLEIGADEVLKTLTITDAGMSKDVELKLA